jgi:hypothetical protein
VPAADLSRFHQLASWPAVLELSEINAPHGFMRYARIDVSALMAGSETFWRATQYLMGDHVIDERMFRHDPSVMLHAPLRTVIYDDPEGATRFAVDQPSLLFAGYAEIAAVGRELDALPTGLIDRLGATPPPELAESQWAKGCSWSKWPPGLSWSRWPSTVMVSSRRARARSAEKPSRTTTRSTDTFSAPSGMV